MLVPGSPGLNSTGPQQRALGVEKEAAEQEERLARSGHLTLTREPLELVDRFACVANLSPAPVALPAHEEVLLTSAPLEDGRLPGDATAWIRLV